MTKSDLLLDRIINGQKRRRLFRHTGTLTSRKQTFISRNYTFEVEYAEKMMLSRGFETLLCSSDELITSKFRFLLVNRQEQ